ncbi:MAG: BMP family ABC transporter substrate-binding protein [Actinomycetaceae bacterium]|nr:BMP family ABC transporter substrate-binding protein [Actinomycetaceae bacterium]
MSKRLYHKASIALVAAVLGCAALLAGCSSKNVAATSTSNNSKDYIACLIATNDHERAQRGLEKAKKEYGITTIYRKANDRNNLSLLLDNLVDDKCNVIIGVGKALIEPMIHHAKSFPAVDYAVMGALKMPDDVPPNLRPISWDAYQPAFMAGYVAAGTAATGNIYAFADKDTPEKRQLMSAFAQGVHAYNNDLSDSQQKNLSHVTINIDVHTGHTTFIGRTLTPTLLQQQVNNAVAAQSSVIFAALDSHMDTLVSQVGSIQGLPLDHRGDPVATDAPSTKTQKRDDTHALATVTLVAWQPLGYDIYDSLIDTKNPLRVKGNPRQTWSETFSKDTMVPPVLTSIMFHTDEMVKRTIEDARTTHLSDKHYFATIENGGSSLSSFHAFNSTVPSALKNKLTTYTARFSSKTLRVDNIDN